MRHNPQGVPPADRAAGILSGLRVGAMIGEQLQLTDLPLAIRQTLDYD